MSSVIIAGDTSGSVTLAAPAVSGTTTLTLPATTDTLVGKTTTDTLTNKTLGAGTVMPTGSVLQVVQATVTGAVSTTSTSDITSGLTASITPSNTSNKILLIVASGKAYSSGGNQLIVTAYRNGSTLGTGARATPVEGTGGVNHSLTYLDSPSSTSSVTYAIFYRTTAGTGYFQDSATYGQATLTLMEIKG